MRAVHSALLDPFLQNGNLACAHRLGLALSSLRHEIFRIFGLYPLDQLALLGVTGHDRVSASIALLHRPLSKIKPQTRLAHFRIGTVTSETTTGQDRLHVLIKIEAPRNLRSVASNAAHRKSQNKETKAET